MLLMKKKLFVGMSYNIITSKKNTNLLYVLGLLNSTFGKSWFYNNAKHRGIGVDVGVEKLRQFPIPNSNTEQENKIIHIVEKINAAKNANSSADTSALEEEIDNLVYKLYELTDEEISIIEGNK